LGIADLDLVPATVAKVKETGKFNAFPDDDLYGPFEYAAVVSFAAWVVTLWKPRSGGAP
jgi:hypothetical protein